MSYAERVIMSRETFKNVFLKIFQVTVSLLAVMVAVFLAHSPDEAKSNLSKWGQYLKIPNAAALFSHLSLLYVFLIVVGALVWVIPYIRKHRPVPFEIIFDPKNPGRQFWSPRTIESFSSQTPGIEYRVKIRNKTQRTIREVKATTETLGPMGSTPVSLIFDQTGKDTFTLDPGASAFVKLFFTPLPLIQPGTLMGASTAAYGPIKVTVSALDARAVEKVFRFNPLRMDFDTRKESLIY